MREKMEGEEGKQPEEWGMEGKDGGRGGWKLQGCIGRAGVLIQGLLTC